MAAEARLRGTLVMLDAAAQCSAGTTAITNACRAGTSIWAKRARTSSRPTAMVPDDAKAARTSKALAGRCVNAIVRTIPIRWAGRCDAAGHPGDERTEGACDHGTEVVDRVQAGAGAALDVLSEERLLGRQEHADVARRGVEGANDGNNHQRPERRRHGEAHAGRSHDDARPHQEAAERGAVGAQPEREGQDGRTDEGPVTIAPT